MATRGITRSGLMYAPRIWNDSGIYSYFYIDFKKPMASFSVGMITESFVVHDSVQLTITSIQKVSASVYKIFCDISGKTRGVTVLNKVTSFLAFATGEKLPPFSVHFYVAGLVPLMRLAYLYEPATFGPISLTAGEQASVSIYDNTLVGLSETTTWAALGLTASERVLITL